MIADIYPECVRYFVLNQTNYPELSYQSYILTLQHTPTGISLSDFRTFHETPHMFFSEQSGKPITSTFPKKFFLREHFGNIGTRFCSLESTEKVVQYDFAIQIFSVNVRVCP